MNEETVKKQNGYRKALSVHLHDQLVIISSEAFSFGTDSGWMLQNEPEFALKASKSVSRLLENLTGRVVDLDGFGFSRSYAAYPEGGPQLTLLEVRLVSERVIDIRMTVSVKKTDGDEWIENWTYSGSYTVFWDDDEAGDA